jgi:hypothetical protein
VSGRDRPRDLPEVALTVGSSWTTDACDRRWLLEKGEGLRPIHRDEAPRYGDAWHAVMEDVHLHWRDFVGYHYQPKFLYRCWACHYRKGPDETRADPDCRVCGGTGLGPVARQERAWRGTDMEDRGEALHRAAVGWLRLRGTILGEGWSVFGVEVPLAFPLPSPTSRHGETYAPLLPVVTRADGTRRLARRGEAVRPLPEGWSWAWERVPAWGSVRVDALLISPGGHLYVGEWKSSMDPGSYLEGLQVDPQVTVYELALEHAIGSSALYLPGPGRLGWTRSEPPQLGGWIYDVASSRMQRDLEPLKAGGFSVAANKLGSVPSWRMRACLLNAGIAFTDAAGKIGDRPVTWNDRIAEATARVDGKLYKRENGASPRELRDEVLLEMFAVARERARRYRAAAIAVESSQVRTAFPRTAVCRGFGVRCPFRGPCIADNADSRRWFTVPDDAQPIPADEELADPDQDDGAGEP